MPGPHRPPRPAALRTLAVAAVFLALLLAGCTGGSKPAAAGSHTPGASATTVPSPAAPSPSRSPKPSSKPTHRPPKHPKPFAFHLASVGHTLTTKKMGPAKIRRAQRSAVKAIRSRFDSLYRMTFVDPAHWKDAKYGEAFQKFFAGQVRKEAASSRKKLTLGPYAGKKFVSVQQPAGNLRMRVLIGAGGGPVTAIVHAMFSEKAQRTNGGTTVVVVDGRYYVAPSKRGWLIDGFRVGRHDHNR